MRVHSIIDRAATADEAQGGVFDPAPVSPHSGFARFFEQEWPRLRNYLKRAVGAQDAEDIAQEAFARLFALGQTRSASGFLYQTARHLVIDDKRRAQRSGAVMIEHEAIESVADPAPSPEERAHWRQRLERAQAMLNRMSPKCRRVFLMRAVDGDSYAEIAAQTGLSIVAVEKQLLRAFRICAECNGGAKRGGKGAPPG